VFLTGCAGRFSDFAEIFDQVLKLDPAQGSERIPFFVDFGQMREACLERRVG